MNLFTAIKAIQVGSSIYDWYKKANSDDEISRHEMADAVTNGLGRINLGNKLNHSRVAHELRSAIAKEGVTLRDIKCEIQLALTICELHYSLFDVQCVVTSANDSHHMTGSLHYENLAIDLRIRTIRADFQKQLASRIRHTLQQIDIAYQVILEHDHLHIEYDVKARAKSD